MLNILGKASSINVRKVMWCCHELQLPFEREDWGGDFQTTHTPEFMAMNPNALVPVVNDNGFVLWESNSIIRYLVNRYGADNTSGSDSLYPAQPEVRARIDQWMDWQATELNNAWRYAYMSLVRRSPAHRDAAAVAASTDEWNRHIGILDRQLQATGGYIAGERFTLADIPVGLSLNRWYATPLTRDEAPAAAAYFERLKGRPGFMLHGHNGTP